MSTPPPLKVLDKRSIVTPRARSGNPPNMSWWSIKPPGRLCFGGSRRLRTDPNALKRSPSAMRLGWRTVTGVKTVQSECGILATATPAPLRKNSGTSSASTIRKQALQHRLYESHGVREASWISLSGCHPNRVQANRCGACLSLRLLSRIYARRPHFLRGLTRSRPAPVNATAHLT